MKPLDIYNQLVAFDGLMNSPLLTDAEKLAVGREALASLPSDMIVPHSAKSLEVVFSLMQRGLDKLEHGNKQGSADAAPTGDDAGAATGSRLPVDGVVDAKEPKVKATKARKP